MVCTKSCLKALFQPSCLVHAVFWMAFVVVIIMSHENGDKQGQPKDDLISKLQTRCIIAHGGNRISNGKLFSLTYEVPDDPKKNSRARS